MRKVLFLLFCLLNICGFAQGISNDHIDSKGIRIIVGDEVNTRSMTDKVVIFVKLSAAQSEGRENTYNLGVRAVSSTPYKIKKGMKLLLKTSKGELIELESDYDVDASVRDIHNVNGIIISDYSETAYYSITEEQISLFSTGISKLRIEVLGSTFDKEYKKDKIGKAILSEYQAIKSALAVKKDIKSDF